jgi:putative FmdB family regulatory protein
MPLYEYRCDACGGQFEVMQKFADQPLTIHEACGGTVHRLLSAPALQFKGSGWYVNDYAKGSKSGSNSGNSNKTDSSSKGESSASSTPSDSSSSPSSTTSTTSSDKK